MQKDRLIVSALLGAERFLRDKLKDIVVAGGLHFGTVLEGSAYPRILFEIIDKPKDVTVSGNMIIATHIDYLVQAIDRNKSQVTSDALADQIHSALHGKDGDYTEGLVMQCLRTNPYSDTTIEAETKETIHSRGGIYHLICK